MKPLVLFGCIAACGTIVGVGMWRVSSPLPAPGRTVIVLDASESSTERCRSARALAARALKRIGPGGGSIAVLRTGDETTANEPVVLASFDIPAALPRALENRKKAEMDANRIVEAVNEYCAKMPVLETSPVFLAIKRGLQHLAGFGDSDRAEHWLDVQSDGQETAERVINAALRSTAVVELPQLDNGRVKVTLCDIANTRGATANSRGQVRTLTAPRTAVSADRIQRVWTSIFVRAENVMVKPYCGTFESVVATR